MSFAHFAVPSIPNNLPLQLASFVGREREIAEVKRLLRVSRLLTLAGAGGSGKTRLALRVASDVLEAPDEDEEAEYEDGIYFVSLASISDPGLLIPTIAQTLQVREVPGQPLDESLKAYLSGKHMLLLLDNFEQLVEAAPQVVDLLKAALDLKVMVTSRTPLHVSGEQRYPVQPLALPDLGKLPDLEALSEVEAVSLFVQRARSVNPRFTLNSENAQAIARICHRLDGLPLAIELAAARLNVLTPQLMLEKLQGSLGLMTAGARDRPARHRTLRNTMEWSYNLLSESEQKLFRRLAVFVGGCTLEAAEAVLPAGNMSDTVIDVLDGMASLIDKSLLRQKEGVGGEPRFRMLETILEYAREKFQESGEHQTVERQHATYFMGLARQAEPHLVGPEQVKWLGRLEQEHDNLRAALRWARENGKRIQENGEHGENVEAAKVGLRLAGDLQQFWRIRGYFSEGREHLAAALNLSTSSLSLRELRANALHGAGLLASEQGDIISARSLYEESLAIRREIGDKRGIAASLNNLGVLTNMQGDVTSARSLYEESLAIRREIGDKRGIALSLTNLGGVAQTSEDIDTARSLQAQSLAIWREVGDKRGIALSLDRLGTLTFEQGDYTGARTFLEESITLRREIGDRWGIATSLHHLASIAFMQDDFASARSLHEESLAIQREIGDARGIIWSLIGLGVVVAKVGEVERGARLLAASAALGETLNAVPDEEDYEVSDRGVTFAKAQVGEERFERAWTEGRGMTMEQAIAYALEKLPEPSPTPTERPALPLTFRALGPQQAPAQSPYAVPRYPEGLTKREVEVLRVVAQGLTNAQIADRLFLSPNTVNVHLYSIYSKLGVNSRSAATRFAFEHNLH